MGRPKLESGLPDAISRREILAGTRKYPGGLEDLGRRYLAAGWLSDAIDCFEAAGNLAILDELKTLAIEQDVFLLVHIAKIDGVTVTAEEWRRAGESALAAGRDRSAAIAFERAGDDERAAAARERVAALRAELKPPSRGRGGLEIV